MKTMRAVMIGRHLTTEGGLIQTTDDGSALSGRLSCLQLYDTALSRDQIKKSMDICDKEGEIVQAEPSS